MIGSLYLPGNTWLHRSPAGLKLAVLAVGSTALMWVHSPSVLLVACVLVCLSVRWAGASVQHVWQQLRPLVWLLFVLGGLSVWSHGVLQALEMVLRLLTLVLAALVVSMTTPLTKMMQVVVWLLWPFQRLGWVDADKVALGVGLTLRLIPELGVQWQDIREAQLARGLTPSPLTMGVPMLLRTLRRADEIAEAIDARG
ncbi:MAG: energy-coupling factor transporter transmembrane protein EcfT [Burkholderiaceae bacterium]|nr:energy-coupling factor transporter transmembrane protein EcfT [Burkholderiaceae bacterium]